jgi:GcrA cell cycle regulator
MTLSRVDRSGRGCEPKRPVWDAITCMRLSGMWTRDKMSASQIALVLGVSRNSVLGKAHRMGLPKRPSPIKRSGQSLRSHA